jgi:ribosomal protein S1
MVMEEMEEKSPENDETPEVVADTATDTGDAGEEQFEDDSEDFAKLYEESIRDLREREVVTGTVVGISQDGVLVDVGYKSEGIIPSVQFQDESGELTVAEGDTVEGFLEKKRGFLRADLSV